MAGVGKLVYCRWLLSSRWNWDLNRKWGGSGPPDPRASSYQHRGPCPLRFGWDHVQNLPELVLVKGHQYRVAKHSRKGQWASWSQPALSTALPRGQPRTCGIGEVPSLCGIEPCKDRRPSGTLPFYRWGNQNMRGQITPARSRIPT